MLFSLSLLAPSPSLPRSLALSLDLTSLSESATFVNILILTKFTSCGSSPSSSSRHRTS